MQEALPHLPTNDWPSGPKGGRRHREPCGPLFRPRGGSRQRHDVAAIQAYVRAAADILLAPRRTQGCSRRCFGPAFVALDDAIPEACSPAPAPRTWTRAEGVFRVRLSADAEDTLDAPASRRVDRPK